MFNFVVLVLGRCRKNQFQSKKNRAFFFIVFCNLTLIFRWQVLPINAQYRISICMSHTTSEEINRYIDKHRIQLTIFTSELIRREQYIYYVS